MRRAISTSSRGRATTSTASPPPRRSPSAIRTRRSTTPTTTNTSRRTTRPRRWGSAWPSSWPCSAWLSPPPAVSGCGAEGSKAHNGRDPAGCLSGGRRGYPRPGRRYAFDDHGPALFLSGPVVLRGGSAGGGERCGPEWRRGGREAAGSPRSRGELRAGRAGEAPLRARKRWFLPGLGPGLEHAARRARGRRLPRHARRRCGPVHGPDGQAGRPERRGLPPDRARPGRDGRGRSRDGLRPVAAGDLSGRVERADPRRGRTGRPGTAAPGPTSWARRIRQCGDLPPGRPVSASGRRLALRLAALALLLALYPRLHWGLFPHALPAATPGSLLL